MTRAEGRPVDSRGPRGRPVTDAVVELRGVGKRYGTGVEALRDVTVGFPRGKLTTLLGPSGCGKTTLLKIVAGLIQPTGGEVRVEGRRVEGPGPERAFVFQDFALLPWATVLRNVAFGLELRGTPREAREATARSWIQRGRPRRVRAELSPPAVRRNAAARRARARARGGRGDHPHGRAVLGRRRADPAEVPGGSAGPPPRPREDRDLRHPQHRGGGVPVRPDRAADAAARDGSTG